MDNTQTYIHLQYFDAIQASIWQEVRKHKCLSANRITIPESLIYLPIQEQTIFYITLKHIYSNKSVTYDTSMQQT